jgi:hypothetical protein
LIDHFSFRFSLSLLTDIDFLPVSLDQTRFPGAPSNIKIHQGFRDAHYDTAIPILNETNRLIAEKGGDNVVLVSLVHSPSMSTTT